MSKNKIIGVIGSILIILGTFFTFAKVEVFGVTARASLIDGFKGIIILFLYFLLLSNMYNIIFEFLGQ